MNDMDRYLEDYDIYRRYPDLYRMLYPKISDCLERHIRDKGEDWEPTDREIEAMIDEVYDKMKRECPEIDEDLDERKNGMSSVDAMQRPFFGRRRLTRDLISIILLGTLLNRRRRRRRFFDYPGYGYYPGYWYY